MSKIIQSYPVFESSQVLTSSQLNQVVSYLDQQNRLTRAKLIGMGIVCGLDLSYDDTGENPEITISKGTAITSEGFLVTLGKCTTKFYRPYELPKGVEYKPFGDPDQEVELYELLTEEPDNTENVEDLNIPSDFLDDKFVLLFLECFDNDVKPCLGNPCDELGIDRIFSIRKLLISQDDLDDVLTRSANVGELFPEKYELPDITLPRALFNQDNPDESTDYTDFSENYVKTFEDTVFPALLGDEGALSATYNVYEELLGPVYDFDNPFETETIEDLKDTWTDFFEGTSSPGREYRGIQYFYDFLKDLILAYDEFRKSAFDLMAECSPDMSRFPKHVMLGQAVVPGETEEEAKKYRHGFTQPPIYNGQKHLAEETISLHKRLVMMVEKFSLNRINVPVEEELQIKITPSFEKTTPLSKRAIPYYYNIKEETDIAGEGTLENYWNHDIARKEAPDTDSLLLSYENQADDESPVADPVSPVETPLHYDLDNYPFLRIEGHIGKDFEGVAESINEIQSYFNLPFETVALQLDPDADLVELDYSCGFEDLQEEYTIARNIFCGFVADFSELLKFIQKNREGVFGDGDDDETNEDLEQIGRINELMMSLCRILASCVDEFDFNEFQKTYKTVLQEILDFILVKKQLLNEINIRSEDVDEQIPVINGLIQRMSPAIYKFVDLLFYNTFLRIYYSFKRREYYLKKQTGVFSSFINEHPGIEHQAGVYKGGTFILVYNSREDNEVIADFNLPYICCGDCVPMCNGDFEFHVPPFARPDYAVTLKGQPVKIDVAINDVDFWDSDFKIKPDEESSNDGEISLSDDGTLKYSPVDDFTGYDTFEYSLINTETEEEDRGTVTVLVKEPEEEETECYTREILECWGEEFVKLALHERELRTIDELLKSLGETGGFTDMEIETSILEGEQSRRELLDCLGIPNDENTSYEELGQKILDYQDEHCSEEERPCTVTEVAGSVTDAVTNEFLPGVNIVVEGTTIGTTTNANGSFELSLNEPGQTLVLSMVGYNTLKYQVCNRSVVKLQLKPRGTSELRIDLNTNLVEISELVTILESRGESVEDTEDEETVLGVFNATERGANLTKDELKLLKNDTLRLLLDDKNISHTTRNTKEDLVNKLLSG